MGFAVWGDTLESLFIHAAEGMTHIILENPGDIQPSINREVSLTADSPEELLVNWLSELNFYFTTDQQLFSQFHLKTDGHHLTAEIGGEVFHPQRHQIRMEIKAVTYHQLSVTHDQSGWHARILFDI